MADLRKERDAIEVKKNSIEKKFETNKKNLNEKIGQLNSILTGEAETRDQWIERYEQEQKEHSVTNARLNQLKGENRDMTLAMTQAEIDLKAAQRNNDMK